MLRQPDSVQSDNPEMDYLEFLETSNNLSVIVSLTRKCVLKCKYCYAISPGEKLRPRISAQLLRKIIRDANGTRHSVVDFEWTGGEPLLAGRVFFEKILKYQRIYLKKKYENAIQTSGAFYDEELLKFLVNNGFRISITLDGPEELQNKQRPYANGKGSFENVIKIVNYLKKIQGKCGTLCTVTKNTLPYSKEITRFYRDIGVNGWQANPYFYDKNKPVGEERLGVTSGEYAGFLKDLFLDWITLDDPNIRQGNVSYFAQSLMAVNRMTPCNHGGRCLTNFIDIDPEGNACLCPKFLGYEEHRLGNIKDKTINELVSLSNSCMKKYFDERLRATKKCVDKKCPYFGGCHGGCPYGSLLNGADSSVSHTDVFCEGKKEVFKYVEDKLNSFGARTIHNH